MKVVTFETSDGKTRYYLADDNEVPVSPVLNYLRFEDNRCLARNILRMHCIHMKHFYTFIEQKGMEYTAVTVDHLLIPQQRIKTVPKADVNTLMKATNNIRDYFLLYLIFETGMRIGEALSLWIEDFEVSACSITIHDRGEMEKLFEKTLRS